MLRIIALFCCFILPLPSLCAAAPADEPQGYRRTEERYTVPDVTLINQDARKVRLTELLAADKPVMVDFVYCTCTTICPLLSAGFSSFQRRLGDRVRDVQLVSFTIDPENDNPENLRDYLERYSRQPGWDYLTGSRADINRVMHAFDAYVPNKMSHYPLTLLRAAGSDRWVRIYGLVSGSELMAEYRRLPGKEVP